MGILQKWLGIIPDAPKDGYTYVRKNGSWVRLDVTTDRDFNESVDNVLK